jgi:hypothetical protein
LLASLQLLTLLLTLVVFLLLTSMMFLLSLSSLNGVPGLAGCPSVCCFCIHSICKLRCFSGVSICVGSPVVAFIPVVAGVPASLLWLACGPAIAGVPLVLTVAGVPGIVGLPTVAFSLLLLAFLL